MKHRVPRKKKKVAKKNKSVNDAMVTVQIALTTASNAVQLAVISSQPFAVPALKALRVVQVVSDTARTIAHLGNQYKHWTNFVPNYQPR